VSGTPLRSTFSVESQPLSPQGIAEKVQAAERGTRHPLLNAGRTPLSHRWAPARQEPVLAWEPGRRLPEGGRSSGWVPAAAPGQASDEEMAGPVSQELFAGAGAGAVALAWVAFAARAYGFSRPSIRPSLVAARSPKLPAPPAAAPRPPESVAAPAAPTSPARPAAPAELPRRPRAATKLETTGPGHASRPKPVSLGCLPRSCR
jgi:hypothetical protein